MIQTSIALKAIPLGLTYKKAPNGLGMELFALVVTLGVDKSNFYGDLEGVMDLDIPSKKEQTVKKDKSTVL